MDPRGVARFGLLLTAVVLVLLGTGLIGVTAFGEQECQPTSLDSRAIEQPSADASVVAFENLSTTRQRLFLQSREGRTPIPSNQSAFFSSKTVAYHGEYYLTEVMIAECGELAPLFYTGGGFLLCLGLGGIVVIRSRR